MKCSNCGSENAEGARFCSFCGSALNNEYEADVLEKDDAAAVDELYIAKLEERASEGDAEAAAELSKMYREGLGVDKDPEKAALWSKVAGEAFGGDIEENEDKPEPEPIKEISEHTKTGGKQLKREALLGMLKWRNLGLYLNLN